MKNLFRTVQRWMERRALSARLEAIRRERIAFEHAEERRALDQRLFRLLKSAA